AIQAANVRSGPGLDFEVIGLIDDNTQAIVVKGRAEDSNWLQIEHNGKLGWLAGDLIAQQYLIDTLPSITSQPAQEIGVVEAEQVKPENVAWPTPQPVVCAAHPIRGFGAVWDNQPEVRKLLGCAFTNFRRDEHATRAAVQTFEHGWMLWLETDTVANVDPIYVFFEDEGS
ncbi:MAG: SH3 domain-containing protein, partial [Chloroflexi bacterium]|nr:SH3 domain-containing protein [Chloroflexota bacterium]